MNITKEEWVAQFLLISKEEIEDPDRLPRHSLLTTEQIINDKRYRRFESLLERHPVRYLKDAWKDPYNDFVDTTYQKYVFQRSVCNDKELQRREVHMKAVLNTCGHNIKTLTIDGYPYSDMLKSIRNNCPNLKKIVLRLKYVKNWDFEHCFDNKYFLKIMKLYWEHDNTLPEQFVTSLLQVVLSLKELLLCNKNESNVIALPTSLSDVFKTTFIVLTKLKIQFFTVNQQIIDSIGLIKSLIELEIKVQNAPLYIENMAPIGNLKELEVVKINFDQGVYDEFIINLAMNSKNLQELIIVGSNITNSAIIALSNHSKNIEILDLMLNKFDKVNDKITDESIKMLINNVKLEKLNLSNINHISNSSLISLLEHLECLEFLWMRKTNVDFNVTEEILELGDSICCRDVKIEVTFQDSGKKFKQIQDEFGICFASDQGLDN